MISDHILAKAKLRYWLDDLRKGREVWGPTGREGRIRFRRNPDSEDVVTEFTNSLDCPKAILFPEREPVFSYQLAGEEGVKVTRFSDDRTPRVIFGLRPPDIRGFEILDAYWLKGDQVDTRYQARREATATVCIGYHNPPPCCFAEAVGMDLFPQTGADVLLTDLGRTYYAQVFTEKGKDLVREQFDPAEQDHRDDARKVHDGVRGKTKFDLKLDRWDEYTDGEILGLPYWDEVYLGMVPGPAISRYFYCGTHYRLLYISHGHRGERYRVWSHPHAPGYSRLANGDDYRPGMKERIRDWLLEMFRHFPKRHGFIGCSGAHRCVASMPTHHDIREIIAGMRFD